MQGDSQREKYPEPYILYNIPASFARGEVALSSRSGACLCRRPLQCGATATAADAAVFYSSRCRWWYVKWPVSIRAKRGVRTFTIKVIEEQCRIDVLIWKEESRVEFPAFWLAWQQGCRWSDSARTVHICLEGERGGRKPALWSSQRSG